MYNIFITLYQCTLCNYATFIKYFKFKFLKNFSVENVCLCCYTFANRNVMTFSRTQPIHALHYLKFSTIYIFLLFYIVQIFPRVKVEKEKESP